MAILTYRELLSDAEIDRTHQTLPDEPDCCWNAIIMQHTCLLCGCRIGWSDSARSANLDCNSIITSRFSRSRTLCSNHAAVRCSYCRYNICTSDDMTPAHLLLANLFCLGAQCPYTSAIADTVSRSTHKNNSTSTSSLRRGMCCIGMISSPGSDKPPQISDARTF